jgi:hypothetical protein
MRAHASIAALQLEGCAALARLTDGNPDAQFKAGSAGALEAIVAALRAHGGEAVQEAGARAMAAICASHGDLRTRARGAGAVDAIKAALAKYPEGSVNEQLRTALYAGACVGHVASRPRCMRALILRATLTRHLLKCRSHGTQAQPGARWRRRGGGAGWCDKGERGRDDDSAQRRHPCAAAPRGRRVAQPRQGAGEGVSSGWDDTCVSYEYGA